MTTVKRKRQTPAEVTEQEMKAKMFLTIPEAAGVLRVRIRKAGKHFNQYLKADWEAARKEAEAKSTSTKSKRETT